LLLLDKDLCFIKPKENTEQTSKKCETKKSPFAHRHLPVGGTLEVGDLSVSSSNSGVRNVGHGGCWFFLFVELQKKKGVKKLIVSLRFLFLLVAVMSTFP